MGKTKSITIGIIGIIILVIVITFIFSNNSKEELNYNGEVKFYKSITCGCCEVYSSYLSQKGKLNVNNIEQEDISAIKEEYGIPSNLQSCHTYIIGGYFVEGHMPLEAVDKLLKEKPDIKGIALPGMPAGSPGMLGTKNAKWTVYSVNKDGTTGEFMTI